jgi:hypothetical protein
MRATLSLRLEDENIMQDRTLLELTLDTDAESFQDTLKRLIAQQMPTFLPAVFAQHAEAVEEKARIAALEADKSTEESPDGSDEAPPQPEG